MPKDLTSTNSPYLPHSGVCNNSAFIEDTLNTSSRPQTPVSPSKDEYEQDPEFKKIMQEAQNAADSVNDGFIQSVEDKLLAPDLDTGEDTNSSRSNSPLLRFTQDINNCKTPNDLSQNNNFYTKIKTYEEKLMGLLVDYNNALSNAKELSLISQERKKFYETQYAYSLKQMEKAKLTRKFVKLDECVQTLTNAIEVVKGINELDTIEIPTTSPKRQALQFHKEQISQSAHEAACDILKKETIKANRFIKQLTDTKDTFDYTITAFKNPPESFVFKFQFDAAERCAKDLRKAASKPVEGQSSTMKKFLSAVTFFAGAVLTLASIGVLPLTLGASTFGIAGGTFLMGLGSAGFFAASRKKAYAKATADFANTVLQKAPTL